jgi:uncharacterized membrane protein YjdF
MKFEIQHLLKMSAGPFFVFMLGFYLENFVPLYQNHEWPNRVVHYLGGFSIAIPIFLVLLFFKSNKLIITASKYLDYLIVLVSAISVAVFWEFYEFAMDIYAPSKYLAQPSVDDTMKDMLMGLLGALTFIVIWWIRDWIKKPVMGKENKKAKSKKS